MSTEKIPTSGENNFDLESGHYGKGRVHIPPPTPSEASPTPEDRPSETIHITHDELVEHNRRYWPGHESR
jgi:hypothetical protein